MALEVQQNGVGAENPQAVREQWIQERMAEFAADPAMRDRALAMLLHDSLRFYETIEQMSAKVRNEGMGGLIKAVMTGGR